MTAVLFFLIGAGALLALAISWGGEHHREMQRNWNIHARKKEWEQESAREALGRIANQNDRATR